MASSQETGGAQTSSAATSLGGEDGVMLIFDQGVQETRFVCAAPASTFVAPGSCPRLKKPIHTNPLHLLKQLMVYVTPNLSFSKPPPTSTSTMPSRADDKRLCKCVKRVITSPNHTKRCAHRDTPWQNKIQTVILQYISIALRLQSQGPSASQQNS